MSKQPLLSPIALTLRRRSNFMLATGVAYLVGACVLFGVIIWARFFFAEPEQLVFTTQNYVFMALNALALATGGLWYIYAGRKLHSLPSTRETKRLLLINLCIGVLTLGGIISAILLVLTALLMHRLPEYAAWKAASHNQQ